MSAKLTVNENGPLKVEGDFALFDAAGRQFGLAGKSVIFICRCGQTKNGPFCDGTHKGCGFVSKSEARDLAQRNPS
jgi:CDGSH-type Zn-finger protein